jgi:uncharacterized caspase-like protein
MIARVTGTRKALLVVTDTYEVVRDREIGGYPVTVLSNLILLYISGHGVKDEAGRLHFGTTDRRCNRLAPTAVSAQFVREQLNHSPSRRKVVWLDCCSGGAFPPGMVSKAQGRVDVLPQLSDGRGSTVMTASTHIQYAFERSEDPKLRGDAQPSVFTSAIVEGLRTGDAELNADGEIEAAELYDYVHDRVKHVAPTGADGMVKLWQINA